MVDIILSYPIPVAIILLAAAWGLAGEIAARTAGVAQNSSRRR